uniref:Uncharacterized protein n=1 Tax=Rhizophora mucronata TaxID=61149 RepID=A0A2P2QNP6_RHIMU
MIGMSNEEWQADIFADSEFYNFCNFRCSKHSISQIFFSLSFYLSSCFLKNT